MLESVISGIMSAICTKTAVAPLERLKMLKQSQMYYETGNYSSILKSYKHIYKNEGFLKGILEEMLLILLELFLRIPLNFLLMNFINPELEIHLNFQIYCFVGHYLVLLKHVLHIH